MYWDTVAIFYDLFEQLTNKKVYRQTGQRVAEEIEANDHVLECACGTGAISVCVAPVCQQLVATDFSEPMLEQTKKKCRHLDNVIVQKADITSLPYPDAAFDKVIAGNVIHLVKDPYAVLDELLRVCKPNGKVIIPTYIQKKGREILLPGQIVGNFRRRL